MRADLRWNPPKPNLTNNNLGKGGHMRTYNVIKPGARRKVNAAARANDRANRYLKILGERDNRENAKKSCPIARASYSTLFSWSCSKISWNQRSTKRKGFHLRPTWVDFCRHCRLPSQTRITKPNELYSRPAVSKKFHEDVWVQDAPPGYNWQNPSTAWANRDWKPEDCSGQETSREEDIA